MPHIIVTADNAEDQNLDGVMLRERVNVEDFDSERFAANLVERLGWAVVDATEAERAPADAIPADAIEADAIGAERAPARRDLVHA
ncbi:MAG TPA: hypothetical protein VE983_09595 [Solirubrobacteraceae bacterium]|nr:hypothetical protein [Solirubrobacteraceae bacterium]